MAATLAGCEDAGDPAQAQIERWVPAVCEQTTDCECGIDVLDGCDATRVAIWEKRLAEGRERGLTYDAECLDSQLEVLSETACRSAGRLCEEHCSVFHGNREEGQSCKAFDAVVSDCEQGLACVDGECGDPCELVTGLASGETCFTDDGLSLECADGRFCDFQTMRCQPLALQGESCFGGNDCGFGLACDWNSETCKVAAGEGQTCDFIDCAEGLWCSYEFEGGNSRCRVAGHEGDSCRDIPCGEDLQCNYGRDVCVSLGELGDSCGEVGCAEGLDCIGNTCRGLSAEGEPCDWQDHCQSGLLCEENVVCVAAPGDGKQCLAGVCGEGLFCDNDPDDPRCTEVVANAELCAGHNQCESGYCPNGFCSPVPIEGEDCTGTFTCARGLTCNGETCELISGTGPAVCSYAGW